jgi:hypothetical protein
MPNPIIAFVDFAEASAARPSRNPVVGSASMITTAKRSTRFGSSRPKSACDRSMPGNLATPKKVLNLLHVTCKHCGQSVDVQDLLASAEQPCPHCGLPLLDDTPASPVPGTRRAGGWARRLQKLYDWSTGNRIAISRADAMKPPPKVCIVCGAAATRVIQESWQIQGGISLGQQYFHVLVPYCERHGRAYLRWTRTMWVITFIVLMPGALGLLRPHYPQELGLPFASDTVWGVFLIVGCVLLIVCSFFVGKVYFMAYDADNIEARRVAPEYIRAWRELQAKRLDDIP